MRSTDYILIKAAVAAEKGEIARAGLRGALAGAGTDVASKGLAALLRAKGVPGGKVVETVGSPLAWVAAYLAARHGGKKKGKKKQGSVKMRVLRRAESPLSKILAKMRRRGVLVTPQTKMSKAKIPLALLAAAGLLGAGAGGYLALRGPKGAVEDTADAAKALYDLKQKIRRSMEGD